MQMKDDYNCVNFVNRLSAQIEIVQKDLRTLEAFMMSDAFMQISEAARQSVRANIGKRVKVAGKCSKMLEQVVDMGKLRTDDEDYW